MQARATAERAAAAEERAAAHEADAAELRRACEVTHYVPRPRTIHRIWCWDVHLCHCLQQRAQLNSYGMMWFQLYLWLDVSRLIVRFNRPLERKHSLPAGEPGRGANRAAAQFVPGKQRVKRKPAVLTTLGKVMCVFRVAEAVAVLGMHNTM